jgi:hypothetical protein
MYPLPADPQAEQVRELSRTVHALEKAVQVLDGRLFGNTTEARGDSLHTTVKNTERLSEETQKVTENLNLEFAKIRAGYFYLAGGLVVSIAVNLIMFFLLLTGSIP